MYTLSSSLMATGTRKVPTSSAILFKPGTTKTGNDGNKWTIVADKRGVQRWKLKKNNTTRSKRTLILSQF
jgi:hypothetical protein